LLSAKSLNTEDGRLFEYGAAVVLGHKEPALAEAPQDFQAALEKFHSNIVLFAHSALYDAPHNPSAMRIHSALICQTTGRITGR
jgi:hypothetical protein